MDLHAVPGEMRRKPRILFVGESICLAHVGWHVGPKKRGTRPPSRAVRSSRMLRTARVRIRFHCGRSRTSTSGAWRAGSSFTRNKVRSICYAST